MSEELATYIAGYINEEYQRQIGIAIANETPLASWYDTVASGEMVLKAVDAYEGGAR